MESASHVRAVQEHRCELQNLEVPVFVAYAVLSVEYVMLAGAFQDDHHRDEQRRQDYDRDAGKEYVEEALEELVHDVLDSIGRIYGITETI